MGIKIIAEVAQAHEGSLGRAYSFIDSAKKAGVDGIKFQTHIARYESSPLEPWRVQFSYEDATRYDYWRRMEFTESQWAGLITHAQDQGLEFIGTPFSTEALDMLRGLGVTSWKVASGEVTNTLLLERIAKLGQPVICSSGMSSWEDIDRNVRLFRDYGCPLTLLQCSSSYPTVPTQVGLNVMQEMKRRYSVRVGLSDHSGDIYAGLAAAALGAELIEVHLCMSRDDFGPDTESSLTPEQLRRLVCGVHSIVEMLEHPVDKDRTAEEMDKMRSIFMKGLYVKRALAKGETVNEDMLGCRKPCIGIPVEQVNRVIGRKTCRDVPQDAFLSWEDLG